MGRTRGRGSLSSGLGHASWRTGRLPDLPGLGAGRGGAGIAASPVCEGHLSGFGAGNPGDQRLLHPAVVHLYGNGDSSSNQSARGSDGHRSLRAKCATTAHGPAFRAKGGSGDRSRFSYRLQNCLPGPARQFVSYGDHLPASRSRCGG